MWNTAGDDDDDDFQIPPSSSSQLSIRKPLHPTISHRPPRKKPRLSPNPGKENIPPAPEFTSDTCFSSGSSILPSSSSTPDCIPSSVDCSGEPFCSLAAEVENDGVLVGGKEKGECFKANREGYSRNSMEARLLSKSRVSLRLEDEEEDECCFVESDSELDVLIKLCSEPEGSNSGGGKDDSIQCPLCETDISGLSEEERHVHTNNCLDTQAPEQVKASSFCLSDLDFRGCSFDLTVLKLVNLSVGLIEVFLFH